jgi:hypothetical protein
LDNRYIKQYTILANDTNTIIKVIVWK